ncbi:protein pinocchio [Arctopsyche grandis]|uniref:protein pinocchio n=1 Tax=Arctopsyche grandis TaxID=121162 RepID=UPI00406D7325
MNKSKYSYLKRLVKGISGSWKVTMEGGSRFTSHEAVNVRKWCAKRIGFHNTTMSIASARPAEINSSLDHISPRSMSNASLESQGGFQPPMEEPRSQGCSYEAVLTIEDLHTQINSCFTCGVNWSQQHVSLDCDECGGYALMRPCPLCEASACGEMWKRDFTVSHASSKARWQGVCKLSDRPTAYQTFPAAISGCQALPPGCSAAARLARDLCQRLEKLSTQQRPS